MEKGNVIHPLIIEQSVNDAETLANGLRNAGYSVRYQQINDEGELRDALAKQTWDLLIANQAVEQLPAMRAIAQVRDSGKDIPCIVLTRQRKELLMDLLNTGAMDVIDEDNKDHLLFVINREMDNLRERRSHRQARSQYHESEKRNRVLLDSSRDPIAYIHDGMHIYVNQSYQEMFGYNDVEELSSIPIMDLIAPNDQSAFKEVLRSLSKELPPEEPMDFQAIRGDGEIFTITMEFSHASIEGEPCTQIIIHRKNDSLELEKEIQQLRQQDLLTGLYNHQYFLERLQQAVDAVSKGEEEYTLLYMEPDNFKNIRYTYGVAESDMILTDIANLLRESVAESTVIARYDSNIFTLLFNGPLKAGEAMAKNLCERMANREFSIRDNEIELTCSIGVMLIPETATEGTRVLSQCETACNKAREDEGNKIHLYSEKDEIAQLEADKAMVALVKYALKEDRFQLQYQPIVSLHAQPGERYEVLLRMFDENNELVMPGKFLSAAQAAGMMTDIDRWVIKNAAKAILTKRKLGQDVQFFIKISAETLRDPSLLLWISKLLQAARLHGDCLVFEISEANALANLKETKTFSDGLKQLHCNFALDHAGVDSDNFQYLKHLKVDYLKIDGSHVHGINTEESQAIINKIIETGRMGGFQTIAEHVQDPTCLATLWQMGVNFIQGYYLQQPGSSLNYDFTAME